MPSGTSITLRDGTLGIADGAFSGCSGLVSIDIPNSVTSIGYGAFSDCSSLISIDIPNSVTSVGDGAFFNCSALTSAIIGNSVSAIGNETFWLCENLNSVVIGNSVTSIGDNAFLDCCLSSIDIPNSVTTIGDQAFFNCYLSSIMIGKSVKYIGTDAFSTNGFYSGPISIIVDNENTAYDSRDDCNAIIETASNKLIRGSENTIIPNTVTSIGNRAFFGCFGLTSIFIPNSVTMIGESAFGYCFSLLEVTISDSVISIGDGAFAYCMNLMRINIPNSVTSIGNSVFLGCYSKPAIFCWALTPPTIGSNIFVMDSYSSIFVYDIALDAYKEADYWKDLTNIIGMPYTFEVDGKSYHATTMNTASVMTHSDEATLYSGDIVIPDSVTYEGMTFAVTGIESNAFDGCFELTSVVIPNSVETIGEQAFQGCTGLKSVTIGSGVTAIGAKAFNYCNALETVKCLGTEPPVMASADCFTTTAYNRAQLLVPRQFVDAYQATDYWCKFAHIDGWGSAGRGDVNGDGVMSITDVTSLIDVLLGHELDSFYFDSADLNSNNRLDIGDVTSLIDNLLNGDY